MMPELSCIDCTLIFKRRKLLVNRGVSIYHIRDFLGHASVMTTQVYLTSNPEVTRAVIEEAALRVAPDSAEYYSTMEKADLMAFLDNLV